MVKLVRFVCPLALAAIAASAAACDSAHGAGRPQTAADSVRADSVARARQDSINRSQPGYVTDSVLPVNEELRRFRAAIGGTPTTELHHASASREELMQRFVQDLATADSADLRTAVLSPREFADLVYPSSQYTKPPYRQAPGFLWMQIDNRSKSGLTRVLRRRAERGLRYMSHTCRPEPEVHGANRLWVDCVIRLRSATGETTNQRLFGTIIERAGRFKFVSYSNQF